MSIFYPDPNDDLLPGMEVVSRVDDRFSDRPRVKELRYTRLSLPEPLRFETVAALREAVRKIRRHWIESRTAGYKILRPSPGKLVVQFWDAARLVPNVPAPPALPRPIRHIQDALAAADRLLAWCDKADAAMMAAGGKGTAKRGVGRKRQPLDPKSLTTKQAETVQIVGECKGDIAEAARRLGKDRKTVKQNYDAAMAKLGKTAVKPKTQRLPSDRRGQANITNGQDRR